MTLVELLAALIVGGLVLQVLLTFFSQQGRAFEHGVSATGLLQNSRFAMATLEKDLRTLGTGVAPLQPPLIYAGPDVIAYNADYATREAGDPVAVYHDPDADPAHVRALTRADRITIPMTTRGYPDTTYRRGEVNSAAETLIFFFQPDPTTTRGDDFVLYRQVNQAAPVVVARNLLRTGDLPFFEYLILDRSDTAGVRLAPWQGAALAHTVPHHGSAADTGVAARIDEVRAVRLRFTVTDGSTGPAERRRVVERVIRFPNAGIATPSVCGDRPRLGTALSAIRVHDGAGTSWVRLTWSAALDEGGGERDVLRYLIWRRTGTGDWGDPYLSIPAGASTYLYDDRTVTAGVSYQYALGAQDCTPTLSTLVASALVTP